MLLDVDRLPRGVQELLHDAAHNTANTADPVPSRVRVEIAGILRDIARTNASAIETFEAPVDLQQARWSEAERLLSEGRPLIRRARAEAMNGKQPLTVLRADRWLNTARAALDAASAVSRRLHAFALSR